MILIIIEGIIAVLLIGVILMQSQGSGLGASFGGGSGGDSFRSRRSVEKLLVYITIILAIVFALFSLLLLIS